MEPESEHEVAVSEIQRKIGRNVILFQQMEYMLKFLLANSSLEGKASELESRKQQKSDRIYNQSMGQLVGELFESTLSITGSDLEEVEELDEAYFSFRFRVETNEAHVEDKKLALASIVAQRNELIHNFLPRLKLESPESRSDVIHFLDNQRDKLKPELDELRKLIDTFQQSRETYLAYLDSDEGKREFELSWLRQSRLVMLLGDIATQLANADGWVSLSVAGQLLRQHAPEHMQQLKEVYGHKTLKPLVIATELFDVKEEATAKGGIRVLFRLKPNWKLKAL